MAKKVIGIAGLSGSGKSVLADLLVKNGAEHFDGKVILEALMVPGEEGHRQIINFFGDEFLLKSGRLNQKKLWKYVYTDWHKLKILDFILQPLLIDRFQKLLDVSKADLVVMEMVGFVDTHWQKLINEWIWIERGNYPGKQLLQIDPIINLSVERILEVQKSLYVKPDIGYKLLTNNSTLSQFKNQLKAYFSDIIPAKK